MTLRYNQLLLITIKIPNKNFKLLKIAYCLYKFLFTLLLFLANRIVNRITLYYFIYYYL